MKKILVIEDNREVRENTAELLEVHHFEVRTAINGKTGFATAKEYLPDMILCDIMMPDSDGRRFLEMARADRDTRDIPVVLFSAAPNGSELQRSMSAQAVGIIRKPFAADELLGAVRRALSLAGNG